MTLEAEKVGDFLLLIAHLKPVFAEAVKRYKINYVYHKDCTGASPKYIGDSLFDDIKGSILGRSSYVCNDKPTQINAATDTFTIKLWYFDVDDEEGHMDEPFIGTHTDVDFYMQPFYFVMTDNWKGKYGKFKIPFRGKYLNPVTVPFVYRFTSGTYESNFFSAALAYGWVFGRTKYFKASDIAPRDHYIALGFIAGLGNVTFTSNDSLKSPQSTVGILYGGHVALSMNNIQLIIAGGLETALQGKGMNTRDWANQNKPWIGIGIGFSVFNLLIPNGSGAAAKPPGGGS